MWCLVINNYKNDFELDFIDVLIFFVFENIYMFENILKVEKV